MILLYIEISFETFFFFEVEFLFKPILHYLYNMVINDGYLLWLCMYVKVKLFIISFKENNIVKILIETDTIYDTHTIW